MRRPMVGDVGVKWYWMVQPHDRKHARCKVLGDGLCAIKMVRYECWDENKKVWVPEPMANHATPEQEAFLGDPIN